MKIIDKIFKLIDPMGYAIKKGMTVGKGCTLADKHGTNFGSEPYLITLADEVRLSGGVQFFTHDGGTWAFRDLDEYKDVFKFGTIYIGKRTFVGHGATILPGVRIGERCVIGAGSIVTKDVPDGMVVAGVPARIICSTDEYAVKCKESYDKIGYDRKEYNKDKKRYLLKMLSNNSNGGINE